MQVDVKIGYNIYIYIYLYLYLNLNIYIYNIYIYIYGGDVVPKRSFIGSPVIIGNCPAMQNRYRGQWQKKRFGRMAPGDPARKKYGGLTGGPENGWFWRWFTMIYL